MNAPFLEANILPNVTCPAPIEALAATPSLLPGESLEVYQMLRQAVFAEIAPKSIIEWLLAIDIAELCWEIQRYRVLRYKVLETSRQRAVASVLSRIDLLGIPLDCRQQAQHRTELNADAWRSDHETRLEIEQRLTAHGFDPCAINAEVHIQARELYLMFESLMISAQQRRATLFREIKYHRQASRSTSI